MATIIYTFTDEAPMRGDLLLPARRRGLCQAAGVDVETRDISLAGRIVAAFSDVPRGPARATPRRARRSGHDARGQHHQAPPTSRPRCRSSRPPSRSSRRAGSTCPTTRRPADRRRARRQCPLRQGQGQRGQSRSPQRGQPDRRAPAAVKNYARKHPHSMGAWTADSRTMSPPWGEHDFRSNEQSVIARRRHPVTIRHTATDGTVTDLRAA